MSSFSHGKPVSGNSNTDEITYFLLAKEFGWTPNQIREMNAKDVKAIITMLSIYNKVRNREIDNLSKKGR